LVDASLVRALLVMGMYSTFFIGALYLEHVRHYSALETGAAFLPWTLTVAVLSQGITARLVERFGPLPVLTAGMAGAVAGLLLFATIGPDTAFFPTIFVACFALGLGVGVAFMPLMTLAMADVPTEDAGLGSGITNLAHQIGGALGVAILGTLAANHTQALLAEDHGRAGALVGGYQLAFVTGAAVVGAGIVLAYALLRPRVPRPELQLAPVPAHGGSAHAPGNPDIEDQAA
jgi:MFS family permease